MLCCAVLIRPTCLYPAVCDKQNKKGMDSVDHDGSLAEMGSLLAQGRLEWRDQVKYYARVRVTV